MLNEFLEDNKGITNDENSTSSKEERESKDTKISSASLQATPTTADYYDKAFSSESFSSFQFPNTISKKKSVNLNTQSKSSEPSPILRNKLLFENVISLSPPSTFSNSSIIFPSLSKINDNTFTHTTSLASSPLTCTTHTSFSKQNSSETLSTKHIVSEHGAGLSPAYHIKLIDAATTCCLEDLSKHDKNSGVLSELATGSLATCSSILEVGKEDQQKQKNSSSLSAAKLRLYIASDKVPKHLFEARKLSRQVNGLDGDKYSNSLDVCRPSLQSTKSIENRSLKSKSPSCDSSKAARKGSEKNDVKSDFCQVYSCEQFLDSNAQSKSHRPAARKSVIELKSKSLDPPLTESDYAQAETSSTFQQSTRSSLFPSRLPSRSLSQHQPEPHTLVTKRRDSETAVLSIADANWLHKISEKQKSLAENTSNNSNSQKSLNIQKLKAFFGETTPKIMEAKKMTSYKGAAKDDLCIKPASLDFQRRIEYASCKYKSSGTPSRIKKSTPLCFKDNPHRPSKKLIKDRDLCGSPKQACKEHKTWRGKMAQTLKRYGSGATASCEQYNGALGVSLEHCVSSFANQYVPLIVETCTSIVEEKGLCNIGVYRVPGNSGSVNTLIELLNKDPCGLCLEDERWQDVNLVSSLLKLFFRKLPDSLITDDLYEAFISANRLENPERRMLKVKKLIHELPEHNFETFSFLAQHLNRVASHEEDNKMDSHNLAIVFGPTLVRPQEDGMVLMVKDMQDQVKVIETIITHCDWLFSSWDEDVYVPIDGDDEDALPVSSMNRVLLEKAQKIENRSSLSF